MTACIPSFLWVTYVFTLALHQKYGLGFARVNLHPCTPSPSPSTPPHPALVGFLPVVPRRFSAPVFSLFVHCGFIYSVCFIFIYPSFLLLVPRKLGGVPRELAFPGYLHLYFITKTRLFKYIENFTSKNWKFSDKKTLIFFHISAQNIEAVLTSTHNLCFWAEIRKIGYTPLNFTPVLL